MDRDGNVLASWGGAGSESGQFAFEPPPNGPQLDGGFIVVGANGYVYVTDAYNHRVQVFDPKGSLARMWEAYGPESTGFDNPGPISADAEGNIYVADIGGVHQFDAHDNYVQTMAAAGEVAIDSEGTSMFIVVAFENLAVKVPAGGGNHRSGAALERKTVSSRRQFGL